MNTSQRNVTFSSSNSKVVSFHLQMSNTFLSFSTILSTPWFNYERRLASSHNSAERNPSSSERREQWGNAGSVCLWTWRQMHLQLAPPWRQASESQSLPEKKGFSLQRLKSSLATSTKWLRFLSFTLFSLVSYSFLIPYCYSFRINFLPSRWLI